MPRNKARARRQAELNRQKALNDANKALGELNRKQDEEKKADQEKLQACMNSSLATAFPNSVSVVLLLFKKLTTKYREPSTRQPLNLASFPVKNKKTQRA